MDKTSAVNLLARERRAFALKLRRAGSSYQQIADAVLVAYADSISPKYDARRAYLDVDKELKIAMRDTHDDAVAVMQLQLQRYDELLRGIWDLAASGDFKGIQSALSVMDRINKLAGIGQEKKDEVEAPVITVIIDRNASDTV